MSLVVDHCYRRKSSWSVFDSPNFPPFLIPRFSGHVDPSPTCGTHRNTPVRGGFSVSLTPHRAHQVSSNLRLREEDHLPPLSTRFFQVLCKGHVHCDPFFRRRKESLPSVAGLLPLWFFFTLRKFLRRKSPSPAQLKASLSPSYSVLFILPSGHHPLLDGGAVMIVSACRDRSAGPPSL